MDGTFGCAGLIDRISTHARRVLALYNRDC
jgi:hypothetical protein